MSDILTPKPEGKGGMIAAVAVVAALVGAAIVGIPRLVALADGKTAPPVVADKPPAKQPASQTGPTNGVAPQPVSPAATTTGDTVTAATQPVDTPPPVATNDPATPVVAAPDNTGPATPQPVDATTPGATEPDATPAPATKPPPPAAPRVGPNERLVKANAPREVIWRLDGKELGRGSDSFIVPKSATTLEAFHAVRAATSTVAVDDKVDYNKIPTGTIIVEANDVEKILVGGESATGKTQLVLPAGKYNLRFTIKSRPSAIVVDLGAGQSRHLSADKNNKITESKGKK